MIKILVCGSGSIGQKHAQNLIDLDADVNIWSARKDNEVTLNQYLDWCDGAVIATSTDNHIKLARKAAIKQKAIYLEKPLSSDYDGVDNLLKEAVNIVTEVGCQMRQHPNLKFLHERLQSGEDGKILAFQAWVGQRLDQWRPNTDYRKSYSADARRGGGALFDLVHEIDLMTWLVGSMQSVYADLRHNSDLEMQADDLANLILVANNGAAGSVQLDMLSPAYRRGLQIICAKAIYKWDMKEGALWRLEGNNPPVCINRIADDYVPANMLFDAMDNFLNRIKNPRLPACCSLEDGAHDLQILLEARISNETGAKRMLEDYQR